MPKGKDLNPDFVVPVENVMQGLVKHCALTMPVVILGRDHKGELHVFGTHSQQHCLDLIADATEWFLIGEVDAEDT